MQLEDRYHLPGEKFLFKQSGITISDYISSANNDNVDPVLKLSRQANEDGDQEGELPALEETRVPAVEETQEEGELPPVVETREEEGRDNQRPWRENYQRTPS